MCVCVCSSTNKSTVRASACVYMCLCAHVSTVSQNGGGREIRMRDVCAGGRGKEFQGLCAETRAGHRIKRAAGGNRVRLPKTRGGVLRTVKDYSPPYSYAYIYVYMFTVNSYTPSANNPFPRLIPRNRLLCITIIQHRRTPNTRFTDPFFHARTHTHTPPPTPRHIEIYTVLRPGQQHVLKCCLPDDNARIYKTSPGLSGSRRDR